MSGKDGYFDEPVAARYDESDPEMFSPERVDPVVDLLAELAGGGRALELAIGTGRDRGSHDVANQGLRSHHFSLVDGTWRYLAVPFRYVWPSELDLMAELAGMRLRDRWAGWHGEPFTSDSRGHVSIWEKP